MNKSIINLVNNIKIALLKKKSIVKTKNTSIIRNIVRLLYVEGFINNYFIINNIIIIHLKYVFEESCIKSIKIISKPSRKKYCNKKNIYNNLNITFINTNKGVITTNKAVQIDTGGEILFEIM